MSLFILRGFFFRFDSTGWVESEPFYYTCVDVRARPIQIAPFLVYYQPTDVTHHPVRWVGKLPPWWEDIISHLEETAHNWLSQSYSSTLLFQPSLGITWDCKQQTHFPGPFILKVYANLLQLQCMKGSHGPSPFPPPSFTGFMKGPSNLHFISWPGGAIQGGGRAQSENPKFVPENGCPAYLLAINLESLPKWAWVFQVKTLNKQSLLNKTWTPTAWESCGLLCHYRQYSHLDICVQKD